MTVKDNHNFIANNLVIHNCAEFVHVPFTSCSLASVDISKIYDEIKKDIDWDKFEKLIRIGINFLNETFKHNNFPLEKIKEITLKYKAIGLGTMGLGHLLYKLKIGYNSKEGLELIDKIYEFFSAISYDESSKRVIRGDDKSYEEFNKDVFLNTNTAKNLFKNPKYKVIKENIEKYGVANSHSTSIAPCGCGLKTTKIQTDLGILSIKDIFELNEINIYKVEKEFENLWIIPKIEINVNTIEGKKRITKLYVNKKDDLITIKTKNGRKFTGTKNHKLLVKKDNNTAIWKRLDRKSTRLNSSHTDISRMPSSA